MPVPEPEETVAKPAVKSGEVCSKAYSNSTTRLPQNPFWVEGHDPKPNPVWVWVGAS